MERIQVYIHVVPSEIPNKDELLPLEQEAAAKLKAQGVLEHVYFTEDKEGVILLFKDLSMDEIKLQVEKLPLFFYFKEVSYLILEQAF